MNTATAFTVILVLNVLWFGAAFRYFSLTPNTAAKLLVPKSARESPLFPTIAASVRFLGGMNLAFAAFAASYDPAIVKLYNDELAKARK